MIAEGVSPALEKQHAKRRLGGGYFVHVVQGKSMPPIRAMSMRARTSALWTAKPGLDLGEDAGAERSAPRARPVGVAGLHHLDKELVLPAVTG